jgi:hypothetical protein
MNGQNPNPQRVAPEPRAPRRALVPAVPKTSSDPPKAQGRHAAITDNLNRWRDYKRWADAIRSTWNSGEKREN